MIPTSAIDEQIQRAFQMLQVDPLQSCKKWSQVSYYIKKGVFLMPGVADAKDRLLLFFLDVKDADALLSLSTYQQIFSYYIESPCNLMSQQELVVLIDRRNSSWSSVLKVVDNLFAYLPAILHACHILKPQGWLERTIYAASAIRSIKERLISCPVVQFHSDMASLQESLDEIKGPAAAVPRPLTRHDWSAYLSLDGSNSDEFSFHLWIAHRESVEQLYAKCTEIGQKLNALRREFQDALLPLDREEDLLAVVSAHRHAYDELSTDLKNWLDHGSALIKKITGSSTSKSTSELPADRQCHIVLIELLLQQLDASHIIFERFWSGHNSRLEEAKQCVEFVIKVKDLQKVLRELVDDESELQPFSLKVETLQSQRASCQEKLERMEELHCQALAAKNSCVDFLAAVLGKSLPEASTEFVISVFPKSETERATLVELKLVEQFDSFLIWLSSEEKNVRAELTLVEKRLTFMAHLDELQAWLADAESLLFEHKTMEARYHTRHQTPHEDTTSSAGDDTSPPPPQRLPTPEETNLQWFSITQDFQQRIRECLSSRVEVVSADVRDPETFHRTYTQYDLPQQTRADFQSDLDKMEQLVKGLDAALVEWQSHRTELAKALGRSGSTQNGVPTETAAPLPEDEKLKKRCGHILHELQHTETEYVNKLRSVLDTFRTVVADPSNSTIIPHMLVNDDTPLFGNWSTILKFHTEQFTKEICACKPDDPFVVGSIFQRHGETLLQLYSVYCMDYVAALQLLHKWGGDDHPLIRKCCEALSHRLAFHTYLHLPIQRVQKYQLFLAQLKSCMEQAINFLQQRDGVDAPLPTWFSTPGHRKELTDGLDTMLNILESVNRSMLQSDIRGYKGRITDLGRLLLHNTEFRVSEQSGTGASGGSLGSGGTGGSGTGGSGSTLSVITSMGSFKPRALFLYQHAILVCKKRRPSDVAGESGGSGPGPSGAGPLTSSGTIFEVQIELLLNKIGLTEVIPGSSASGKSRMSGNSSSTSDSRKFTLWTEHRLGEYHFQAPSLDVKRVWVAQIKALLMQQLQELRDLQKRRISQQIPEVGAGGVVTLPIVHHIPVSNNLSPKTTKKSSKKSHK